MNNVARTEKSPVARDEQTTALAERYIRPRASIFETSDSVILELEMPGATRESIDVTVHNDELTVTGARKREATDNVEVVHQERFPFDFRRQFVLSERIDGNKIQALYENGILRLTLPKSEDAKPKKITIQ